LLQGYYMWGWTFSISALQPHVKYSVFIYGPLCVTFLDDQAEEEAGFIQPSSYTA
jgi:hypothetical protein